MPTTFAESALIFTTFATTSSPRGDLVLCADVEQDDVPEDAGRSTRWKVGDQRCRCRNNWRCTAACPLQFPQIVTAHGRHNELVIARRGCGRDISWLPRRLTGRLRNLFAGRFDSRAIYARGCPRINSDVGRCARCAINVARHR